MRLASVEVIPYALPFKEPYVTARGTLTRREVVLLRLRDEEGLVGLGEAVPLSLRGGASLVEVVSELEDLAAGNVLQRTLEQDRMNEPHEPGEFLAGDPALSAPARCAASTAILDLTERRAFLGYGSSSDPGPKSRMSFERHDPGPVPCNATLVAGEPAAVAEDALRWAAEGYSTFKLKLGTAKDVEQVQAVREAVGEEARIRVDANAAWSLEAARKNLAALEPFGIELVEQPVEKVEDAARLAWETCIPLAADEGVASREEAEQALLLGAYRLSGIKLSKVGGISEGRRIAGLLHSYVSSALDGPVGIAAGAHLAQQIHYEGANPYAPRLAHGLATQRLFAATVATVECELRDGMLHLPPGPGLGVEIDEEALDHHRL